MKRAIVNVGSDLAKSVFQVHAIGGDGAVHAITSVVALPLKVRPWLHCSNR